MSAAIHPFARDIAAPVVCWPWHLWRLAVDNGRHPLGRACRTCGRDIAVPASATGRGAICLYCALDSGAAAAVERPFGDDTRFAG